MHTTTLRKVGGSVMLTVPPALLSDLRLRPGTKVALSAESGRLIVKSQEAPRRRSRYTLEQLLAQCTPRAAAKSARSKADRAWVSGKRAGKELI